MLKLISYALCVAIVFSVGFQTGKSIQENKQASIESYLRQHYEQQQDDIIKAKDEAINLLKDELISQSNTIATLRTTTSRLQYNLKESNDRLSAKANNTCKAERTLLRECQGLLGEGSGLLEQGVSLLREIALNNDALVTIYRQQQQQQKTKHKENSNSNKE